MKFACKVESSAASLARPGCEYPVTVYLERPASLLMVPCPKSSGGDNRVTLQLSLDPEKPKAIIIAGQRAGIWESWETTIDEVSKALSSYRAS